jgi:hypothetical protein
MILKNVTREAKKKDYNRQVLKSNNKIRSVWNIIKSVTGKLTKVNPIKGLKVIGEVISTRQAIADSLNSFFVSVAENNISKHTKTDNKPLDYLRQVFHHSFPSIKYQTITTTEIVKIIKFLKTKSSYGYNEISFKVL